MKISLDDIIAIVDDARRAEMLRGPRNIPRASPCALNPTDEPSSDEINVIGSTVEEATERVDKFLDQAAVAGKSRVRIIHGHGKGALRRGLAEFLTAHPARRAHLARTRRPRWHRHHHRRIESLTAR